MGTFIKTIAALSALLLAAGCAHQPYPPLPEAIGDIGGDVAVVEVPADAVARDLKPPPDPASLPAASKRQLDIRLGTQTFRYFEDGALVWSGPVSSGSPEHPTPRGDFKVLSKQVNKRSGKYTNYFNQPTPMPYSLQFSGPYFIHEGWLPGHAASHGCVRLRYEDAKFLYARVKVGDRVVVAD